jgi:hypothetical protein
MVEKITKVIAVFRSSHLRMEEYVCLKVIAMVSDEGEFIMCTRTSQDRGCYENMSEFQFVMMFFRFICNELCRAWHKTNTLKVSTKNIWRQHFAIYNYTVINRPPSLTS